MIDINLTERLPQNTDWATLLFLGATVFVVLSKILFEKKFVDFTNIILSNKYFNTYRDSGNLMSWFNIMLVIVQFISFAFFIHLILSYFHITEKTNWWHFLQVIGGLSSYILLKFIIEKIISFTFEIGDFHYFFNLQKVSYKNLIGLLIIPINVLLFYNSSPHIYVVYSVLLLFILLNFISYITILISNLKNISNKYFYFFLYLCALEIAPYFIIYYWFIKLNSI